MKQEEAYDFELLKQALVFTTRINERGWVVLRTEYNGRWLESILMGEDKHEDAAQKRSIDAATLTIWMEERTMCPACERFQDLHVIGKDLCKCEYCNHEFTVWLQED